MKTNIIFILYFFIINDLASCIKLNPKNPGTFDIDLVDLRQDKEGYVKSLTNIKHHILNNGFETGLLSLNNAEFHDLDLHKTIRSFFTGYIYIGSPPQIVPVVFDTGSGYNWFASSYCIENKKCLGVEAYYNHTISNSFKPDKIELEVVYGKGRLSGHFGSDVIALSPKIILLDQRVGEVVDVQDNILIQGGISGIIGLAYGKTTLFNHTFFDNLKESKQLTRNVISFYYGLDRGQINFGYIDANKYKGDLVGHPVIDQYFWALKLNDFKLNNTSFKTCADGCNVIIDTGTSAILIPSKLYAHILGNIQLKEDCSNLSMMPDIQLIITNVEYILNPVDYIIQFHNPILGISRCELNILGFDALKRPHGENIVLGETFIKKYYTAFDRDTNIVYLGLSNKN